MAGLWEADIHVDALPQASSAGVEDGGMKRSIVGFHRDQEGHWVAELECGHNQHVRHRPPWTSRPWVTTAQGRESRLGTPLNCAKCERREPRISA
jgi:hypothetical protein